MKTFLKKMARSDKYLAKFMLFLTKIGLPEKITNQLTILYLQSEAERPELSEFLSWAIDRTKERPPEDNVVLSKSAVIKPALDEEKGIILVGFEHELDKLASCKNFNYIALKYDILFMPTWQPFYSAALLRVLKKAKNNLVLLPSSENCYYKALALPHHFRALPFHASSWVNHELYQPKNKDIDILMVANFAIYKRHNLLFEALVHLPPDLKVVLIGRPLGNRTNAVLLEEAKLYGVQDRFDLIEAPSNEMVVDHLCRAKLVLGLSGREGSYVSLAEALFADAAVAVFADAHIGTKNYINPRTGFLLQPGLPLSKQLLECLKCADTLNPREWAIANISANLNMSRLNRLMKAEATRGERKWSRDCDSFYIQSFEIMPTNGRWDEVIISQAQEMNELGISMRTQLNN